MENHPGKQYYHKKYGCLSQVIRKPGVRYALPERGWGLPVDGV
jgi:hypothetical protein